MNWAHACESVALLLLAVCVAIVVYPLWRDYAKRRRREQRLIRHGYRYYL